LQEKEKAQCSSLPKNQKPCWNSILLSRNPVHSVIATMHPLPHHLKGRRPIVTSDMNFVIRHAEWAEGAGTYCDPDMVGCKTPGTPTAPHPRWCTVPNTTRTGDGAYFEDAATVADAKKKLAYAVQEGTPFFLGVGTVLSRFADVSSALSFC
jgi:hypothetical protein